MQATQALSRLIKERMSAMGLNSRQLAKRVNRSQATVNRWVEAKIIVPDGLRPEVASLLGVDFNLFWDACYDAEKEKALASTQAPVPSVRVLTNRVEDLERAVEELRRQQSQRP